MSLTQDVTKIIQACFLIDHHTHTYEIISLGEIANQLALQFYGEKLTRHSGLYAAITYQQNITLNYSAYLKRRNI